MKTALPPALQAVVARDAAGVRPTEAARVGLGRLVLLVPPILVGLVAAFGLRPDHATLGRGLLWMGSALELAAAALLATFALRDATPGKRPPAALLLPLALAAIGLHAGLAGLTWSSSPFALPVGAAWQTGALCGTLESILALALGGGLILLLRRSLSPRPSATALAVGLAAALGGDALWRTICPYTDASHLVGGHALGAAIGALVLAVIGRRWLLGR